VGVKAVDAATLVVELEEPIGHFLYLLAYYATFAIPRHVAEVYGEEWSLPKHLVTNGPFRLDAWRRGEAVVCATPRIMAALAAIWCASNSICGNGQATPWRHMSKINTMLAGSIQKYSNKHGGAIHTNT
jgi:hypothetical protein